jgi:L-glyceraldehyde 3-phosphate reductase
MPSTPEADRYGQMKYNRVGRPGLMLPALPLGLWHNFGDDTPHDRKIAMFRTAFDLGITHFDLANNYGPPPGSAELACGCILRDKFAGLRDELVISTKAGHSMWDGPYGNWGSRKHVIASCDQSLKRLWLDYVDIFCSHRPDPVTPIDETWLSSNKSTSLCGRKHQTMEIRILSLASSLGGEKDVDRPDG